MKTRSRRMPTRKLRKKVKMNYFNGKRRRHLFLP